VKRARRGGRPLGPDFARLLTANTVSNVGDGVRLAAGPLLVASLTDDPGLVGGAVFVQQLPWPLLSLVAGAYVDRLDRRRLLVTVNLLRALVAGALALAVATDTASIPLVYAAVFVVGVAEVLADTASSALVPAVVASAHLPRANARLAAALVVGNQFAGPPLGAWLFLMGAALPFGVEAAGFLLAALLLCRLRWRPTAEVVESRSRGWLRRDVAEGLHWLWHHPGVRLLAVVLGVMNVTFMAAFAVWVLYALDRLGLSAAGFGLLLTASAAGGLVGAASTGRLTDRFGAATLLRAGLLVETAVHVVLALTRSPWVAGAAMVAFGAHAAVWGIVVVTIRQRLVPPGLLGRVNSVYFLLTMGGAAVGALVGGLLARALGLTAPFWIAAAGNALLIVAVWHRFTSASLEPPAAGLPGEIRQRPEGDEVES
jgi:MFS family permease